MICPTASAGLDICPTRDEIVPQLIAELPRGRAWGTHDGGPFPGSTSYGFWTAVAEIWAQVNARICALAPEFFCATQVETHDTWMEEYGLPDGCDPYPDLCTKVAAVGGTRCEYYTALAARSGWSVRCADVVTACGPKAGRAKAGCATAGRGLAAAKLYIEVSLSDSPAYSGQASPSLPSYAGRKPPLAGRAKAGQRLGCPPPPISGRPFAGVMRAGRKLGCPPDISGLQCLLARIVGAHILIIYGVAP